MRGMRSCLYVQLRLVRLELVGCIRCRARQVKLVIRKVLVIRKEDRRQLASRQLVVAGLGWWQRQVGVKSQWLVGGTWTWLADIIDRLYYYARRRTCRL